MGSRLFPLIMETFAEPFTNKPFIDLLNRLEQLGILDSAFSWIQLRKVRNDIAHEYPASLIESIEGMNLLFEQLDMLKQIVAKCHSIILK